jgi:hypothetical protein
MPALISAPNGRTALDLFSGTGQATAGFERRGWRVIRVDVDGRHHPTLVADVRRLPLDRPVDFLWASPPCTEFSTANPRIDHTTKRPSLELVFAALRAVAELRPRFWVLENVRGAIPFLGTPAQKIGPWCLWGYFPPIRVSFEMQTYLKAMAGRSAVARAAIPPALAEAVARAVEDYWSVASLLDLRPFRRHRHRAARPDDGRSLALLFEP